MEEIHTIRSESGSDSSVASWEDPDFVPNMNIGRTRLENILNIVKDFDKQELQVFLALEAERNAEILNKIRDYFNATRKRGALLTVDKALEKFEKYTLEGSAGAEGPLGPLLSFKQSIEMITFQIDPSTSSHVKHVVIAALREKGKIAIQRKDAHERRWVIRGLRRVLRTMTQQERNDVLERYVSLQALGNFYLDSPIDHNPFFWFDKEVTQLLSSSDGDMSPTMSDDAIDERFNLFDDEDFKRGTGLLLDEMDTDYYASEYNVNHRVAHFAEVVQTPRRDLVKELYKDAGTRDLDLFFL